MEFILSQMLPVKEDDCHVWKTRLSHFILKMYRNIESVICHEEIYKYRLPNMSTGGLLYFKVKIAEVFGNLGLQNLHWNIAACVFINELCNINMIVVFSFSPRKLNYLKQRDEKLIFDELNLNQIVLFNK